MVWIPGIPSSKGLGFLGVPELLECVGQLREEVQRLHYEAADRLTLRSNLRPRHVFLITNNAVLVMCRAGLRQLEWHMEQYHRGVSCVDRVLRRRFPKEMYEYVSSFLKK